MNFMKSKNMRGGAVAMLAGALLLCGISAQASPAKFDIPGAFPGDFRIDFLATDFKLSGGSTGALSTASTIDFSVGAQTMPDSGIYAINVAPAGFNFVGFQPVSYLPVDVYGAGIGTGTFDTNTGNWSLDMPTLFVINNYDWGSGSGFRVDLHLTTRNISIPDHLGYAGYSTTYASPMVLDPASPDPWGNLHLVAAGYTPIDEDATLNYDLTLINSIAAKYTGGWHLGNPFPGLQYEFDIAGNDPQVTSAVPEPVSVMLLMSGLAGLAGLKSKRC